MGKVHAHDMHDAVVACGVIQIGGRLVAVKPEPGKVERRSRADPEPDDLGVEPARRLDVKRTDRVMVDAFDVHRVLLNTLLATLPPVASTARGTRRAGS